MERTSMTDTYCPLTDEFKGNLHAAIDEIGHGIDGFYAIRDGSLTLSEETAIAWLRSARERLVRLVQPGA
jgi:hypothetical protein